MVNGSDLERDNLQDEMYLPRLYIGRHISHYYGDHVRRIFVGVALILLVSAPFFAGSAFVLLPIQIACALFLITLSALTNPKNKMIMLANAVASFLGVIAFEMVAFAAYTAGSPIAMLGFQAIAIAFISSFYLSLKTVRAMELGQIGKRDLPGEFLAEKHRHTKDDL